MRVIIGAPTAFRTWAKIGTMSPCGAWRTAAPAISSRPRSDARHACVQESLREPVRAEPPGLRRFFYSLMESAKLAGLEPRAYLGEAARRAI